MNLPVPSSTVVFREMPEGAILFCTATETYFSLNSVGVSIWRLLPPTCHTEAQLVASLSGQHPEVSADAIATDVRSLLSELARNGLVEAARA